MADLHDSLSGGLICLIRALGLSNTGLSKVSVVWAIDVGPQGGGEGGRVDGHPGVAVLLVAATAAAGQVHGVSLATGLGPELGGLALVRHFDVLAKAGTRVTASLTAPKHLWGSHHRAHLLVVALLFNVLQSLGQPTVVLRVKHFGVLLGGWAYLQANKNTFVIIKNNSPLKRYRPDPSI